MGMGEEQVERRLAAILAADVVGYSRLMEANEERTLGALRQHRREFFDPTMAKHGGRIFKVMGAHRFVMPGAQPASAHLAGNLVHDDAVKHWLDHFLDVWLQSGKE